MVDPTQILLISAITVMTVLLTILGIQLLFVLKDLRRLLTKTNKIIDQLEKVGVSFGQGYSEIVGFFSGLKHLLSVLDLLAKKKKKKNEE